jgi:hypothetical protein
MARANFEVSLEDLCHQMRYDLDRDLERRVRDVRSALHRDLDARSALHRDLERKVHGELKAAAAKRVDELDSRPLPASSRFAAAAAEFSIAATYATPRAKHEPPAPPSKDQCEDALARFFEAERRIEALVAAKEAEVAAQRKRRDLFAAFENQQREAGTVLLQKAAMIDGSAEWSRRLREKVTATTAAAAERDRLQVVVDLDW